MANIVLDGRKIKALEVLKAWGVYAGKTEAYVNALWDELVFDEALFAEFLYYIDHHELLDQYKCHGFSLTDLYVVRLKDFNIRSDYGKNTSDCNKEAMVLETFVEMLRLKRDPDHFIKVLEEGRDQDRLW
ncbi:MAG: hypothetical protein MJ105_02250 [Lachnospiraceae bacterium]|nr:hypothetical protein [Lachnospiraceae bacterium]